MKKLRPAMTKAAVILALLGAFTLLVAAGGSEPVWEQLADAPNPRQEVSYVALDGKIYLAAGNDLAHDRYDPATDEWEPVAPLPTEFEGVDHVHGVAVGGRIVYIGGLQEWNYPFPVIGEVAVYDPVADEFEAGAAMPSPRAAGGVTAWRGRVIYAGGLGPNGAVSRVDAYDPVADEWTRLKDMPRARDHFQVAVVGDELYAVGGRDTFEDEGIRTEEIAPVDVLDLPADPVDLNAATWRKDVTSLPTPRGGHGVAAVGDCIYAIGGEGAPGEGVTGATEAYSTATGDWHQVAPLWTPRHGIQAAVLGQTIYVAGGGEEEEEWAPTTAHEALDVGADARCAGAEDPGDEPSAKDQGAPPQGQGPPAVPAAAAQGRALARLEVHPRRLRLRGAPSSGRKTRFVLVLNETATVRLWVERKIVRKNAASGCRPDRGQGCSTWARLPWRLHEELPLGRSVIGFPGSTGERPLDPGRYRLVATIGAPNPAQRFHATFQVLP